jgi:DNA-binding NarL/FixJ family response regulator
MEANNYGLLSIEDLMGNQPISIAIAESDDTFLSIIKYVVTKNQHINLVQVSKNGYHFLNYCIHNVLPDVLLISYELDLIDGIQTTAILKRLFPHVKVIILSNHLTLQALTLSIKVGALGFKPKSIFNELDKSPDKSKIEARLMNAIYKVNNGDYHISNLILKDLPITPEFLQARALSAMDDKIFLKTMEQLKLTEKESIVILLYCTNLTKPQIADLLDISTKTLDNHLTHIARKIKSNSTKEMVLQLYRLGIIKTASFNKVNELIVKTE